MSSAIPNFTPADLVRSVNKRIRQSYLRKRLLTSYKALERMSVSGINIEKLQENIEKIKNQIKSLGGEFDKTEHDLSKLKKQYEKLLINSILADKNKNLIKDEIVNKIKIRFQKVNDLPTKELRTIIDQGKKEYAICFNHTYI